MKKYLFLPVLALFLVSCYGPPGPPGPPGDGDLAQVFEVTANFNADNNYEYYAAFPGNINVYDSDVVQAYILAGVEQGTDVWEPLPQTLFFGNEMLLYGYNYTKFDIIFFLDGTVNLSLLDPSYKDNVIFRVAIIPAEFAKNVDVKNYYDVIKHVDSDNIIKPD